MCQGNYKYNLNIQQYSEYHELFVKYELTLKKMASFLKFAEQNIFYIERKVESQV